MKKIRKIEVPAKNAVKKLRVAAYCRVSTKYESQKSSIELQKAHYEKFIQEQPNWLLAGVYVDYGSRCRIAKRAEFQKMIKRALNGEEWIKEELGKRICGGEYDEEVIRKKISRVLVGKEGQLKILFRD